MCKPDLKSKPTGTTHYRDYNGMFPWYRKSGGKFYYWENGSWEESGLKNVGAILKSISGRQGTDPDSVKELAIKDLMKIDDIYHEQAAAIYDAGYRKVSP